MSISVLTCNLKGCLLLGAWKGNSDNVEPSDSSGDGRHSIRRRVELS